jgi:hypothetical protein
MNTTIVIKIESGVVADVYSADPLRVIVVDYDMIEGGETLERRIQKAVLPMTTEHGVPPEETDELVRSLVLECRRPADENILPGPSEHVEAAA